MAALFACTKCHKRHPFEELSSSEQLCKDCRNHYPVVKCTYCRGEFQQEEKGSINSICKKCTQNVKLYGKPTVCEYCNILAAFIGFKCQRCTNAERKWGPPSTCEQCKQKCAFDRNDGSRKKVDGKLLCWLCTLAYKRVLAKARIREEEARKSLPSTQQKSLEEKVDKNDKFDSIMNIKSEDSKYDNIGSVSSRHSNGSQGDQEKLEFPEEGSDLPNSSSAGGHSHSHRHKHHKHHRDHHRRSHGRHKHHHKHKSSEPNTPSDTPPNKVSRMDSKNNANGLTPTKSSGLGSSMSLSLLNASALDKPVEDPHSSEHLIALQQLQEQLDSSKKQLQLKDQQLLERDKKITELKAQLYEMEKEYRIKQQTQLKQHTESLDALQTKNRDLMKQLASVKTKGKSKGSTASPSLGT
ncbi:protein FAM76A isoform X2 [Magallana gigas]|uniref:Protein FAM76A n=1 Tax=Magallana gigas TaxID=29159 RepID=A0A8W8JKT6_MAGGI|nr:protein FAM76B isoform X2 [Crassostrea gigas]|eukprot:XP_011413933.1 PREDICTED: protein FAM76B isoform X2 [Crassostrea gigas]